VIKADKKEKKNILPMYIQMASKLHMNFFRSRLDLDQKISKGEFITK